MRENISAVGALGWASKIRNVISHVFQIVDLRSLMSLN